MATTSDTVIGGLGDEAQRLGSSTFKGRRGARPGLAGSKRSLTFIDVDTFLSSAQVNATANSVTLPDADRFARLEGIERDLFESRRSIIDEAQQVWGAIADQFGDAQTEAKTIGARLTAEYERMLGANPSIYSFRINPHRLRIQEEKLQDVVYTGAGYERFIWDNALQRWNYEGSTGPLRVPPILSGLGIYDIRLTGAWIRFQAFKDFYRKQHRDVIVLFGSSLAMGYISTFEHSFEAENPFEITYSLEVDIYPETVADILTGSISKAAELFQRKSHLSNLPGFATSGDTDALLPRLSIRTQS